MKWIIVAAASFSSVDYASANFVDGNALLEYCDHYPNNASGYVMGVIDHEITMGVGVSVDGATYTKRQFICIPDGVKGGQVIDISCGYLRSNPQSRHWSANVLVYDAVRKAFPCR